jgi:pimeloyl-ACP methyl ester carboxylesterase
LSTWGAAKAKRVLAALLRIGWVIKREASSHKTLSRPGWPDYVFAFHDGEEIGPRMLARIARNNIPTLIVTGRFDDRTPTEYARRIAATLSRAYLVELPDEGHDARGSACHAAIVAQFLDNPARRPDTSCVGVIPPIQFATTRE